MKKGRVVVALLAAMAVSLVLAGCLGLGYAVSGQITDAGGAKIAGVTLTFSGGYGTATTGADGKWSKSGLKGTVTITAIWRTSTVTSPRRHGTWWLQTIRGTVHRGRYPC